MNTPSRIGPRDQSNSGEFARYYAAIRYLESVGNVGKGYQKTSLKAHARPEMFLERMRDLLDLLGNPEKDFKYIHITGTAGKGTVATGVHDVLVRSKKRVGLFTSPFTVSTIEKIQVNDRYIDPLVLTDITEKMQPSIEQMTENGRNGSPSYFEMMLAIALIYFKREKCEYVVLEVGLGGRYDATNVITEPLVTAITNVGLDHTNILGETRSEIARDKAGITKSGSHFFTTEEDPEILRIFEKACSSVGAEYHPIDVAGLDHEVRNRLLVGHICTDLGIIDRSERIGELSGLPARFEIMEKKPLVIIDGAHNPSKFGSTIHNLSKYKYKKLILIVAIAADKDWRTMIRMIAPLAHEVIVTSFQVYGRSSVDPHLVMEEVRKCNPGPFLISCEPDPVLAYEDARQKMSMDDVLLITGSFYLAGAIRALYCPEEQILRNRNSRI